MKLLFIGIQGSGKGTQGKIISEKLKIPHISTGDLLRSAKGKLKEKIDEFSSKGELVPDEIVLELLKERVKGEEGFILDGFPRNLKQAEELDKIFDVDKVVEIFISDEEALKRLLGRRSCPKCGANYNIYTAPKPKKEGICDVCGTKLEKRADDNEDSIKKRIEIYHRQTEPILNHYKNKLIKINGEQEIQKVCDDILSSLKK